MISICSLIYRSTRYASAVWNSAHGFTPELHDGRARFFFVANDPTPEVMGYLKGGNFPHVVQVNPRLNDTELKNLGFDPPEYMRRVYQGWNRAVKESEDSFVLVNSDMMFSENWLSNLTKHLKPKTIVSSRLVERRHPKYGLFPSALECDCGDHPNRFKQRKFLEFAADRSQPTISGGGAFMPCAMMKPVEPYPEGNPSGTFGDAFAFRKMLQDGWTHITANDSIVYHFKEGEQVE